MRSIGDFFKRIQNTRASGFFLQSAISEIVKKITNITVPSESIKISSSKIVLNGISQAARSEIFIKREAILTEINKVAGKVKITEIR
jgi:RAB protein geranylgeranyltransferase component A